VNKDSTPTTFFFLFFMDVIQVLAIETNKYYIQYLGTLENDRGCLQHIFLAIIIQMVYNVTDTLKSYWSNAKQFYTPFYTNTMKHGLVFSILRLLHFKDNMKHPDKYDNNYDRL
jgi:hypothetical protein